MLKGTKFAPASTTILHRLILAIDGQEKHGKTSFACTAPGPIAIFNTDYGVMDVVPRFVLAGKEIFVSSYKIPASQKAAEAEWLRFRSEFIQALRECRSVVVDTATDIWELIRLAEFGKLTQVKPHHYGSVNAIMRRLLRESYDHEANLLLLHKVKKQYQEGKGGGGNWTGKWERAGFDETRHIVQSNLRCQRNGDGEFNTLIKDCRHDMQLAGVQLEGDFNKFSQLAMLVFPNSQESDWA